MTSGTIATHERIDHALCGEPVALAPGSAAVRLATTANMAVDDRGLVHGGFVFGLLDHAAMLAVNDPNVVLGQAQVRFLRPVRVGEAVVARATVTAEAGKKRTVAVEVVRESGEAVATGELVCFVLDRHVLDG
jgi:uncharacterized protein (TIGR00369 family)